MAERLNVNTAEAADSSGKGPDGYYTIQMRQMLEVSGNPAAVVAILKFNGLPEGFDPEDGESIQLHVDRVSEGTMSFPNRGFVAGLTAVSVDTANDLMIVNFAVDGSSDLAAFHLDHAAFVQMQFQRSATTFVLNRPGTKYSLAIELDRPVEDEDEDEIEVDVDEETDPSEVLIENELLQAETALKEAEAELAEEEVENDALRSAVESTLTETTEDSQ